MTNCRNTEPDPRPDRPGRDLGFDTVRMVAVGKQRLRVAVREGIGDGPPLLLCSSIGVVPDRRGRSSGRHRRSLLQCEKLSLGPARPSVSEET